MMKRTHQAFSGVFWLGLTLPVDVALQRAGAPPAGGALVAFLGVPLAVPLSAGHNSPDIDHMWAPGPPRMNYNWRYHRGFTHRVWFAGVMTLVLAGLPLAVAARLGLHLQVWVLPLVFAPVAGWWSHLVGDMIYGRILILGRRVGLGWETGGLSETGRRKYGGPRWVIDPAAKVCVGLSAALALAHLVLIGWSPPA